MNLSLHRQRARETAEESPLCYYQIDEVGGAGGKSTPPPIPQVGSMLTKALTSVMLYSPIVPSHGVIFPLLTRIPFLL